MTGGMCGRGAAVPRTEYFDCCVLTTRPYDLVAGWFCGLQSATLARIERVDFDLFLADLDFDEQGRNALLKLDMIGGRSVREGTTEQEERGRDGVPGSPLLELEWRRRALLRRAVLEDKAPLSAAVQDVADLEDEMLRRLAPVGDHGGE